MAKKPASPSGTATPRLPIAVPHAIRTRTLIRIGALLWWQFRDAESLLVDLAVRALRVGFPTLYLPLPVSDQVAYTRALIRSTANVPKRLRVPGRRGRSWRYYRLDPQMPVPRAVRAYCAKHTPPRPLIAGIQIWHPGSNDLRPYETRLWCVLRRDARAQSLTPGNRLRIFDAHPQPTPKDVSMRRRMRRYYNRAISHVGAPEIGAGVIAALDAYWGVRLRPSLWAVPGTRGILLAEATTDYLRGAGSTMAGLLDLYDRPRKRGAGASGGGAGSPAGGVAPLVRFSLSAEGELLVSRLRQAIDAKAGTGALRSRWLELAAFEKRVDENAPLLGWDVDELLPSINAARRLLAKEAKHRRISLERTATAKEIDQLARALEEVREMARRGDARALRQADALLVEAQDGARGKGLSRELARLRRLTAAAGDLNKKPLFEALESAIAYIQERI